MNESAPNSVAARVAASRSLCDQKARTRALTRILRFVSAIAVGLAFSAATLLMALRLIHCFQPNLLPWTLKSAYPLILVGIAFACLQFASLRTRTQIVLGLVVALAFILWGTEQFLSNHEVVSFIDDMVVFLFVLDLGIVIYGHLKPGEHPLSHELPLDGPDQ